MGFDLKRKSIGIIGGGASGLVAAIIAAREGARVTILEGTDRVGKKILSTGNGKCNLGNLDLDTTKYYCKDQSFLEAVMEGCSIQEVIRFFQSIGLLIRNKEGYLYPNSEQASAVLDVLRYEVQSLNIEVITEAKVSRILEKKTGFEVTTAAKDKPFYFDRLILCAGGKCAPKTGSDGSGYALAKGLGHHINSVVPALVQVRCKESYFKALAGVRAKGRVKTLGLEEEGEIQFTDYGISGIPVFQLSREIAYALLHNKEVEVELDLLQEVSTEDLQIMFESRLLLLQERTVEQFFTGILNKKIMQVLLRTCALKEENPVSDYSKEMLWSVLQLAKHFVVTATGTNSFEQAQVCAGGVDISEVTTHMESKLAKHLYFAGEVLDVDGKCGGYNLYFAWATGMIAATYAVKDET